MTPQSPVFISLPLALEWGPGKLSLYVEAWACCWSLAMPYMGLSQCGCCHAGVMAAARYATTWVHRVAEVLQIAVCNLPIANGCKLQALGK